MDEKPITPFDELTTPSSLQLLKLFIPYIPPTQQKTFAVYEKYLELKSTIDFYQKMGNTVHIQETASQDLSITSMLEMIKPYMNQSEQEMMDSIANAMNMMEMFQEFQKMENDYGDQSMDESSETTENESEETRAD